VEIIVSIQPLVSFESFDETGGRFFGKFQDLKRSKKFCEMSTTAITKFSQTLVFGFESLNQKTTLGIQTVKDLSAYFLALSQLEATHAKSLQAHAKTVPGKFVFLMFHLVTRIQFTFKKKKKEIMTFVCNQVKTITGCLLLFVLMVNSNIIFSHFYLTSRYFFVC
jgi:hypothetical protein